MNKNMKRQVVLSERGKIAILSNWDISTMHPLLLPLLQSLSPHKYNMTVKRDKFKLTENPPNYSRSQF